MVDRNGKVLKIQASRAPDGRARIVALMGDREIAADVCDLHSSEDRDRVADAIHKATPGAQLIEIQQELLKIDRDKLPDVDNSDEESDQNKSQSTLLVELTADLEKWHTPGQTSAFVTIDGREHWPIKSNTFRRWLGRQFYESFGKSPGSQALQDAINVLEGQAFFDGSEHQVYVRIAGHNDKLYLDLAQETWKVVEIDSTGWRIIDSADCPVRFRRAKATLPLPTPESGGDISELQKFVNVDDEGWPLLLAWLVACFRNVGPYPILALYGEQGSAKSTTARIIRSLIDPNAAPLRSEPKEPRDLMIAANNGWVMAMDNLSHIPGWLSDALCRLATGGGFATRMQYTDDDEMIFDAQRPAILTGIEEIADRSDLLDRCIVLHLPRIPETKRRTEEEHRRQWQLAHPRILGALLDAVSAALRNLPGTRVEQLPRMADFALWATAAENGLGLSSGAFMRAYLGNRGSANETILEASLVAKYVLGMGDWEGTASELLEKISSMATEVEKRDKSWPKNARALAGQLKRLAPNLRAAGIEVENGSSGRGSNRRKRWAFRKGPEFCASSDPTVPTPCSPGLADDCRGANIGNGTADCGNGGAIPNETNPLFSNLGTQKDDGGAIPPTCSKGPRVQGVI